MTRAALSKVLFLAWLPASVLPAAQQHPSRLRNVPETAANQLHEELNQGKKILVIDVQSEKEYAGGHVPGAINIPIDTLSKRIRKMQVPKGTTIVAVCERGGRSSRAVAELQKLGFHASSFSRLDGWKREGYKIETGSRDPDGTSQVYQFFCQHGCQTYIETTDLETRCDHCDCKRHFGECMKGD